jgi:hypothetical protein
MGAQGTATLDFGVTPGGNAASVAVTGQASIVGGSLAEAWMMADSTADHNAEEHALVPVKLAAGTVVAGTGFTIYGRCEWRLNGTFQVRWVWN